MSLTEKSLEVHTCRTVVGRRLASGAKRATHQRAPRFLWRHDEDGPGRVLEGPWSKLTPQEAQISRLVAQGNTNREIAARLSARARSSTTCPRCSASSK